MSAAEPLPFSLRFCSGVGQFDVRAPLKSDGNPNLRPKAGRAYDVVTEAEIAAMVANPPQVPKEAGRWMIPSLYSAADARTFAIQRLRGAFGCLTLDVDTGNHALDTVDAAVEQTLGPCRRYVYSTRSSKPDNRKSRVLVPLQSLIDGGDYADTAAAFFDLLEEGTGVRTDRTLARAAQLVYLPNRGAFYEHRIVDGPPLALPESHAVIRRRTATRQKLAEAAAWAKAQREARARKAPSGGDSIIKAFNARHSVADMLMRHGYYQGDEVNWRSPYQTTGSCATRDFGDHWVSLSASDSAEGLGHQSKNGQRAGDAFDLFVHFDHGGDFDAAVRAYAEELGGHRTWRATAAEEFEPGNDNVAAAPASSEPELPIICAASFAGRPVPERQAIDKQHMIPMAAVTGCGGDGGTGKSQLFLQLSCGVALTGLWLGIPVRRGPVLYFSAEDDRDELHARLAAIAEGDGFGLAELVDLHLAVMAGRDAVLATEDTKKGRMQATALLREIRETLARLRPVLLILDNLADVFAGNENNRTLARQFVSMLRGLAIEFGCAIVLLSHPSLTGLNSGSGTSGTTGWNNSYRSRLYLRREIDDKGQERDKTRRVLEHKKANYTSGDLVLSLQWQGGRFTPMDGLNELDGTFDADARRSRAERVFLDLVRWHRKHGVNVSNMLGPNYAPVVFADHTLSEGLGKREFKAAMDALFDKDLLAIHESGPPSRRVRTIVAPLEELL